MDELRIRWLREDRERMERQYRELLDRVLNPPDDAPAAHQDTGEPASTLHALLRHSDDDIAAAVDALSQDDLDRLAKIVDCIARSGAHTRG
jgi:hypothetical protein